MSLQPPSVLTAAPDVAPPCRRCRKPSTLLQTGSSNGNGNADRPYYKCLSCGKFLVFADKRGNCPTNPPCFCGVTGKRQVSGGNKRNARQVHYVCRLGRCDFYKVHLTPQGETISLTGGLVDELARLNII